jgi:outer membrane protein assembly factor BamE
MPANAAQKRPVQLEMICKGLIMLALLLAGCSSPRTWTVPGFTSYKIDIQQGNVVTKDMVAKLKPGMTRSQVRFVLGTPLLVDPFRTDRWDYVYTLEKKGDRAEQRQLRVFFENDKMVRYEGDLASDAKVDDAATAKPQATPAAKPGADVTAKPVAAPATPARDAGAVDNITPQLRLAPSAGVPAAAEERAPQTAPTSSPATAIKPATGNLDAPPLPRMELPPEKPEAETAKPEAPAKP